MVPRSVGGALSKVRRARRTISQESPPLHPFRSRSCEPLSEERTPGEDRRRRCAGRWIRERPAEREPKAGAASQWDPLRPVDEAGQRSWSPTVVSTAAEGLPAVTFCASLLRCPSERHSGGYFAMASRKQKHHAEDHVVFPKRSHMESKWSRGPTRTEPPREQRHTHTNEGVVDTGYGLLGTETFPPKDGMI